MKNNKPSRGQTRENLDEDEIISYLKTKIAKYAIPKAVFFVDRMPLTEVQKLNKKAIREIAESMMDEKALKNYNFAARAFFP